MPLAGHEVNLLKFRATDRWLRDQSFPVSGKAIRPLSVAADKLGAVALRHARLFECLAAERSDGRPPTKLSTASLAPWMSLGGSYKQATPASKAPRKRIVDQGLDVVGVF